MNQEFYKSVYQSSRPRTTLKKEKETLIIDSGAPAGTEEAVPGAPAARLLNFKAVTTNNGSVINLKVTIDNAITISNRSYIKLNYIILNDIKNTVHEAVIQRAAGETHTSSAGINFKLMLPGIQVNSSLLHLSIKNFKINNTSNLGNDTILGSTYDLSNSTIVSLSSEKNEGRSDIHDIKILNSNKYDYIGLINPTKIKNIELNLTWVGENAWYSAGWNQERIIIELLFEPI